MKVTVVYTTQIKAALGIASEEVTLGGRSTVHDLMQQLVEQHGDEFRRLTFCEDQSLLPSLLLCIGDSQVAAGDNPILASGDVVTLLSAISGG